VSIVGERMVSKMRDWARNRLLDCPVSLELLKRLYVDEQMSVKNIGTYLYEQGLTTRRYTYKPIYRWLKEAGVERRSPEERRSVALKHGLGHDHLMKRLVPYTCDQCGKVATRLPENMRSVNYCSYRCIYRAKWGSGRTRGEVSVVVKEEGV
jgi:endogenous inhibitor of DNA gyrase (YacG/DUF329 family)